MNLNKTLKIKNFEINLLDMLALIAIVTVGVLIRAFLYGFESTDYELYLSRWTSVLDSEGFSALSGSWYNYSGIYMYLLYIIAKLPCSYLAGIKTLSLIFDLLLAGAVACVVKLLNKDSNPLIPFGVVWFAPTVIANSGMWGQCDSIYAFFIVLSLYFILKDDSLKAMLFFSVAFALKLQSIFFAPVLILLFFLKKIKFWEFLLIPATYFVSILPMWIAGRPLIECLTIYMGQTGGNNDGISINYPNIYYLLENDCYIDLYHVPAILFTVSVLLVIMYHILKTCYKKGIDNSIIIQTALLAGSLILFFLPNMRERYSYVIDIIAIIYALYIPKKYYVPVLKILISFIGYQTYFVFGPYFNYEILAFIQIILIFDCTVTLLKYLRDYNANGNQ